MMYPFVFWVEYYDEIDEISKKASGCTFAASYTGAVEKIESCYGDDLESCQVKCLGLYEGDEVLTFATYEEADKIYAEVL